MPLVEIFVSDKRSPSERRKVADAVHHALVLAIGIPHDDRFQLVRALAEGEYIADPSYLGLSRTADFLVVRITLRRGRTLEQKQALYRSLADGASKAIGLRLEDVLVVLSENDASDWSFGAGLAQYAAAK
jgi:phenylpyruvate tautomerase PptA (4-oxalocrotonate tautomerase family)